MKHYFASIYFKTNVSPEENLERKLADILDQWFEIEDIHVESAAHDEITDARDEALADRIAEREEDEMVRREEETQ